MRYRANDDWPLAARLVGLGLGWTSLAIAIYGMYRMYVLLIDFANRNPPGSRIRLEIVVGMGGIAFIDVMVCMSCGIAAIILQKGRWHAWVIAVIAFAIALAEWPLGKMFLDYIVKKNGIIDIG